MAIAPGCVGMPAGVETASDGDQVRWAAAGDGARAQAGTGAGAQAGSGGGDKAGADPFYRKERIVGTWVMIWNGSTERGWWKPEDYNGCRVQVGGRWQSIDWNDRTHIETYFAAMREAGMDLIAVDFTNGFRWEWQAKLVQRLCHAHGMKFVVAFNPQAGAAMESGCQTIWEKYAAPGVEDAEAYYHQDGKPLVVLYTWRQGYADSVASTGTFRGKFTTVWASGEDSDKDKWGWQLEPAVGPVPSTGAMFVTGSVKFDSPRTPEERWRKSLAWLDYGFLMAGRSQPRVLMVGSFDDVHERNAWMVADTAAAKPGWQMRDPSGKLSATAWYQRVSDWVKRGKPSVVAGGWLRDGAYQLVAADGRMAGVADNRKAGAPLVLKPADPGVDSYFWFYHLGGNEYRVIKLNAALTVEAAPQAAVIAWDHEGEAQRWRLAKEDGGVVLASKSDGRVLEHVDGRLVTRPRDPARASQRWSLVEVITLPP